MSIIHSVRKRALLYRQAVTNKLAPPNDSYNRKVLVIQLDHLGDVCTLIPVVASLTKLFETDIVCKSGLEELWKEFLPETRVHPLQNSVWSPKIIHEQVPEIFNGAYEATFVATIAPFSGFLASLPISKKRYGLIENGKYYKGSSLIFNKVYNAPPEEHVSLRFKKLFELFPKVQLEPPQSDFSHQGTAHPYILIHPGGKWKPRRWPKERYVELARILAQKGNICIFLLHENEHDLLEYFGKVLIPEKNISISVTKNVLDLANAIRNCTLFIGNDSGPAHLANLYRKKSIILWGPGNYQRIRPLGDNNTILIQDIDCRPCRQYRNPDTCQQGENRCLLNISVQNVLDKVPNKTPEAT